MTTKREYKITNAQIAINETGAEILQVRAKVTDHLSVGHGEHGEEIPRTKTQTIGVAIPVLDLPYTTKAKKKQVMDAVKTAYNARTQAESEGSEYVGYTSIVSV